MIGFARTAYDGAKGVNAPSPHNLSQNVAPRQLLSFRTQSLGIPSHLMRIFLCVFALIALTAAAFADNGSIILTPNATAVTVGTGAVGTNLSSGTAAYGVGMTVGGGGKAWTVSAQFKSTPVSGTGGNEASVTLNLSALTPGASGFTVGYSSGASIPLTKGNVNATMILSGSGTGSIVAPHSIVTAGVSLTVPSGAAPGTTYTGEIDLTLSETNATPAILLYSYTVPGSAGGMTVTGGPITTFTQSGSPQSAPWQFTAANNTVTTSIYVAAASTAFSLKAQAAPGVGDPATSVAMNLVPITQSAYSFSPSLVATTTASILGAGATIAAGTTSGTPPSGEVPIFTSGLVITVPSSATPGPYSGTVTLTLTGNTNPIQASFSYTYTVPTYLNVSVDQGLHFNIGTPGIASGPVAGAGDPNPYITIGSTGNTAFHLTAAVTALTIVGGTPIPTSQQWLAIDTSFGAAGTDALNAVGANPSGLASIRYPASTALALGVYTLYLSEYLKTTVANIPGTYTGTLTITIVGG